MVGRFPVSLVASIVVEVNSPDEFIEAFSTALIWNLTSFDPSALRVRSSEELLIVDIIQPPLGIFL
jgi:hypothetical protein